MLKYFIASIILSVLSPSAFAYECRAHTAAEFVQNVLTIASEKAAKFGEHSNIRPQSMPSLGEYSIEYCKVPEMDGIKGLMLQAKENFFMGKYVSSVGDLEEILERLNPFINVDPNFPINSKCTLKNHILIGINSDEARVAGRGARLTITGYTRQENLLMAVVRADSSTPGYEDAGIRRGQSGTMFQDDLLKCHEATRLGITEE